MNLFFLRHGIAAERNPKNFPDDSRRPLTVKGEYQIRLVCDAIQGIEVTFDHISSSPILRARQTAEIVASELNVRHLLCFDDELKPGGEFRAIVRSINLIRPVPENLLLVGHEPNLGQLISRLISGHDNPVLDLKKGGFAKLQIKERLRPTACATLKWLITPKQMALMVPSR
jgi:phosphohistidine phosphatase